MSDQCRCGKYSHNANSTQSSESGRNSEASNASAPHFLRERFALELRPIRRPHAALPFGPGVAAPIKRVRRMPCRRRPPPGLNSRPPIRGGRRPTCGFHRSSCRRRRPPSGAGTCSRPRRPPTGVVGGQRLDRLVGHAAVLLVGKHPGWGNITIHHHTGPETFHHRPKPHRNPTLTTSQENIIAPRTEVGPVFYLTSN